MFQNFKGNQENHYQSIKGLDKDEEKLCKFQSVERHVT